MLRNSDKKNMTLSDREKRHTSYSLGHRMTMAACIIYHVPSRLKDDIGRTGTISSGFARLLVLSRIMGHTCCLCRCCRCCWVPPTPSSSLLLTFEISLLSLLLLLVAPSASCRALNHWWLFTFVHIRSSVGDERSNEFGSDIKVVSKADGCARN